MSERLRAHPIDLGHGTTIERLEGSWALTDRNNDVLLSDQEMLALCEFVKNTSETEITAKSLTC